MDFRDRMLEVVRGEKRNGLVFVPRLDVWYNKNKTQATLPDGFDRQSLREIAERLKVGFHSVIPDFIRSGHESDLYHRALGFYNHPDFPYRADFSNIDFKTAGDGDKLTVKYYTSTGELSTSIKWGNELFASGVSIPDILESAIKTADDYRKVAEIFSKIKIIDTPERYDRYHARIGTAGLAVAYISLACSPYQFIMRDLRKMELFFTDLYDCPQAIDALAEVTEGLYEKMINAALATRAEVVLLGANYDATITYPPFFRDYCLPYLKKAARQCHNTGKFLLTHTDGENKGLTDLYLESEFDIADSVCPAPMTKLSLTECREIFRDKITIWGGIPSVLMLKSSCPFSDFRNYIDGIITGCAPYDHLILSIADTMPPDADFSRLLYISESVQKVNQQHG